MCCGFYVQWEHEAQIQEKLQVYLGTECLLQTDHDWKSLIRDAEDKEPSVVQHVQSVEEFPDIIRRCCFKPKYQDKIFLTTKEKPTW